MYFSPSFFPSPATLFKNNLKPKINPKCRIRNRNLLRLPHQIPHPPLQIPPRLHLQRRRRLIIQTSILRPQRRLLELCLRPLAQTLNELLQRHVRTDPKSPGEVPTNWTVVFFLVRESEGINTLVATILHVIVQVRITPRGDFERFITAARSNDGVCRRNGRNDVLHHPLRESVGDAGDTELFCASQGFLVEPGNVFGIVGVEDVVFAVFFPRDYVGPFDAVSGLTRDGGKGAERDSWPRGVHVQLAFYAGGESGEDDARLAFESCG